MKQTRTQCLIILIITTLHSAIMYGQAPESFKYQAVARYSNGNIMANEQVNLQFSIREGSPTGLSSYVEQHVDTTNAMGLLDLEIGNGTVIAGNFASIDWGDHSYFLRVEMNGVHTGTVQLVSVPYALHSKTVEENDDADADADPNNELQTLDLTDNTLSLSSGNSVNLPWTKDADTVYYNSGSVGIGTSSPAAKLDVQGGDITTTGYVHVPKRPAFSVVLRESWSHVVLTQQ